MTAKLLFRIASVVFILFAAGHTAGFLSFRPPTPEGIAVRDAMNNVHFADGASSFSYGGFYRGFGLSVAVSTLFEAFLCWQLASMTALAPRSVAAIAWVLCLVQVAGFAISLMYFPLPPAVFSLAAGALLAFAALRSRAAPKTF